MSSWQDADNEWPGSQRSCDPLFRIRPLLPRVSLEAKVLPERALAPDCARCQRVGSRHSSPQDEDESVFEIARSKEADRDALCAFEDPSWLRANAITGPFRGTRRVPSRRHRAKPQDHGDPTTGPTTRPGTSVEAQWGKLGHQANFRKCAGHRTAPNLPPAPRTSITIGFFDSIGQIQTSRPHRASTDLAIVRAYTPRVNSI